jgi:hypothetical protein
MAKRSLLQKMSAGLDPDECNSSSDPSPGLEALIEAELSKAPTKRPRRRLPPEWKNISGRLAWKIWRDRLTYHRNPAVFEDWWATLDEPRKEQIVGAAKRYSSFGQLLEDTAAKAAGPTIGTVSDQEWLLGCVRDVLKIDTVEFLKLLTSPMSERSKFAEEFGRRATKALKQALLIPPHRPKKRMSGADLKDDEWARKLFVFLLNVT